VDTQWEKMEHLNLRVLKEQVIRLPNPMFNSLRTGKPSIEELKLPPLEQEILRKILDWLRINTFTK
jgi:hypothetical protein